MRRRRAAKPAERASASASCECAAAVSLTDGRQDEVLRLDALAIDGKPGIVSTRAVLQGLARYAGHAAARVRVPAPRPRHVSTEPSATTRAQPSSTALWATYCRASATQRLLRPVPRVPSVPRPRARWAARARPASGLGLACRLEHRPPRAVPSQPLLHTHPCRAAALRRRRCRRSRPIGRRRLLLLRGRR